MNQPGIEHATAESTGYPPAQRGALHRRDGMQRWSSVGAALAKPAAGHPDDPVDVIWFPNPPYAVNRKGVPAGFEIDL